MKSKCRNFFYKHNMLIFFFIFFVINLSCHLPMKLNGDAAEWFAVALSDRNLFEFLKLRYLQWSSRTFIDCILVILCYLPFGVWQVLDSLIYTTIGVIICKIVNTDKVTVRFCVFALCLAYPFLDMNTAGWLATTLNYLWPLLGILGGVYYILLSAKKKLHKSEIGIACIMLLFGANLEQGVAILFGFLIAYDLICLRENIRITSLLKISHIVIIVDFLYIVLCPGNRMRAISEEASSFPEFATLSLFDKCELGMSSTLYHFIFNLEPLFLMFVLCLLIAVFELKKDVIFRTIAVVPLFISTVFCVFGNELYAIFPGFAGLKGVMSDTGVWDFDNPASIGCWLIMLVVVICIILSLYAIYEKSPATGVSIFVTIMLGFASRSLMGFSPTIWVSSDRTYIFLYFSFIISIVYLLNMISSVKSRNTLISIFTVIGFLSGLHLWMYTAGGSL